MIDFLGLNFWKEYPELTIAPEMDELYKKDKSKDKTKSSTLMWAIHICENPSSKFFNHSDKYTVIADKVLKDKNTDWDKHEKLVESYKNFALTDAQRSLNIWNETIIMRNRSLKEMYKEAIDLKDTDELVKLDKMLANNSKMFEEYKKIKMDFEEEKVKGNKRNQSLSDRDEM